MAVNYVALNEQLFTSRTQLSGLRRAYLDGGSPNAMKKLQLLKAREKFMNNSPNSNTVEGEEKIDREAYETNNNNNSINPNNNKINGDFDQSGRTEVVVPRSPNRRRLADKALLERLSALSSQRSSLRSSMANTLSSKRSSRSSKIDSQYNSIIDTSTADLLQDPETSAEIFNVLRKLHDSIDQVDDEDDDVNVRNEQENNKNSDDAIGVHYGDRKVKQRDSDPLLPEERSLIEGLLYKYQHLQSTSNTPSSTPPEPYAQHHHEERILFSSKVKIRGTSPSHSRTASTRLSDGRTSSIISSNKMENLREESSREATDKSREQSLDNVFHNEDKSNDCRTIDIPDSTGRDSDHSDQGPRAQKTSNDRPTPNKAKLKRYTRKVSTVKEVAGKFEALNRNDCTRDEPKVSIIPEQKYYDISSDSSSSSEYEDDILKTHEGFIIPDDTIHKLNISSSSAAQRLQEEEEEIERQFKKENFLKDRPARKGMRMPIATTGKVNQLKSKFEGKHLGKSNFGIL